MSILNFKPITSPYVMLLVTSLNSDYNNSFCQQILEKNSKTVENMQFSRSLVYISTNQEEEKKADNSNNNTLVNLLLQLYVSNSSDNITTSKKIVSNNIGYMIDRQLVTLSNAPMAKSVGAIRKEISSGILKDEQIEKIIRQVLQKKKR